MAFKTRNVTPELRWVLCRLFIAVLVAASCCAVLPSRALAEDQPPAAHRVLNAATAASPDPTSDHASKDSGAPDAASAKSATEKSDAAVTRIYDAYRDAVFGYTLTLAYMRNDPELTIYPGTNIDVSVESYHNNKDSSFQAALAGPARNLVTLEITPGLRISPFVLNWSAGYSSFHGSQTYQTLSNGALARGQVQGEYLYGAGNINQWLLWDSSWAPGGLHTWAGFGLGLLRFNGDLDYSVGGLDYAGHISSDGSKLHMVQTFGMELRIRRIFIAAMGFQMSANGTKPVRAQFSVNGQQVGNYYETFVIRSYLIGYAISF